jgi:hypothetical protein
MRIKMDIDGMIPFLGEQQQGKKNDNDNAEFFHCLLLLFNYSILCPLTHIISKKHARVLQFWESVKISFLSIKAAAYGFS